MVKPKAMSNKSDIRGNNNPVFQGIEKSTINVTINGEQRTIAKHLGSIPTYPQLFIGRDDEVKTVHQRLVNQENILLLVNGRGGIGKTTLASKYYYQYHDYYQHLVWVFSGTSIVDALLTLALPLDVEFPNKANNDQRLNILLQTMAELSKPCLLIVDNANELKDIEKYHGVLLKCTNFHVLLTTRVNKEILNTQLYQVKPLNQNDALAIFKKHYPNHDASEDALFFSLFQKVNRNTLVIELLAKNLANFNNSLKKKYALSDLLTDISNNLLALSKSKKVATFYQAQTGIQHKETPENIIAAMYDLVKLSADEQKILSIFSVLPAESIPFQRLETLILNENLDEILLDLFHKGWLDYDKNNATFRISPVVQEVVKSKNNNLRQDCQELIDKLQSELHLDKLHIENYKHSTVFVKYAISIIDNFKIADFDLNLLSKKIGTFYTETGGLNNALFYYKSSQNILLQLLEEVTNNSNHKNSLAISYEKLGSTHSALGNLKKGLEFFEKYNQLEKALYKSYPNNVLYQNNLAISYEKLGSTHSALGNLKKGLEFFEKDIELTKALYESYPSNVSYKNSLAISYSRLGSTHSALGNLNKALEFFEKYNQLEKELHEDYPNNVSYKNGLAISYSKLGSTHSALGNLKKALEFLKNIIN